MKIRLNYFAVLLATLMVAASLSAETSAASPIQFPRGAINGKESGDEADIGETKRPTRSRKVARKTRGRTAAGDENESEMTVHSRRKRRNRARALSGKGSICGDCEFDTYYYFKELGKNNFFFDALTKEPTTCVLAAIRDHESRRAAQYAIPDGLVAITQGYFPIDDYIDHCSFQDSKSEDGEVEFCEDSYENYFVNYEGTDVPSDSDCWTSAVDLEERDIPDGAIHVGIGSDGLLRPVQNWNRDTENSEFAWDGAVYECCPFTTEICEIEVIDSEDT